MTDDENTRTKYQVAVNLWGNLVSSSWSRFNAMLVANSVIIAAIGVLLTNGNFKLLVLFLSSIGFALTLTWQSMMDRDAEFQYIYALSARRFERSLDPRGPVVLGAQLVHGCTVEDIDDPVKCEQHRYNNRKVRLEGFAKWDIKSNTNATIWLFRFVYIIFFWWVSLPSGIAKLLLI